MIQIFLFAKAQSLQVTAIDVDSLIVSIAIAICYVAKQCVRRNDT